MDQATEVIEALADGRWEDAESTLAESQNQLEYGGGSDGSITEYRWQALDRLVRARHELLNARAKFLSIWDLDGWPKRKELR